VSCRLRRGLAVWVAAVLAGAGLVVVGPQPAVVAAPVCSGVADTEAEASELAAACGEPVVVDGSRTEFAQVVARPDGRLRFESAVVPQRARTESGWADVDLGLVRGGDGRWRPAVSVADVSFSGGGSGPLVSVTRAGSTLAMSWPGGVLPAPVVSGESATYPEVLPGVDLVVRATWTGFSHTLVVKSPAAAANPAVGRIRFGLGGDARVRADADGRLWAVAGAGVIASAEPPVMWDSRGSSVAGRAAGSESTAAAPGDAARVAAVDVEVSGGDLVLRPDAGLLTAPDVVFPVYVDPAWSVTKARWAYATDDGSSNSDTSRARVGRSPETGAIYRSFFEFPTTANGVSLKGKHIESAYVQMKLDHSWSCDSTVTTMYRTSVINSTPRASWSTGLKAFMASASGHANEAGGCGEIQPDMIMNFTGSSVTSQVQLGANERWNTITVGFTARDSEGKGESTQARWKKFFPNDAKLIVDYDSKPGKPINLQIAGIACQAGAVQTIGTVTPTFSATYPDADGSQSLTGTYEWIEVPAGGLGTVTDTSSPRKTAPPNASAPAGGRGTTAAVSGVTPGKTYAFRVKTTDPAPYALSSAWSDWCQFTADLTVPSVTVTVVTAPQNMRGPGEPITFRIESNDADVTVFKYGWNGPTTVVTPTDTTPKTATVTLRPPKYGTNILYVSAVDATLNEGYGSVEFVVNRPSPPVAMWGLETYPGVDQGQALADRQPALAGDTPLTTSNVTWVTDARLVGGQTASFNGVNSEAVTAGPVIDTTNSFSVAAWVRPASVPTGHLKVLAQEGVDAARFEFGVRIRGDGLPYWSLVMKETAAQSSASLATIAPTPITTADVGRWTHIAGVYDRTAGMLRLYVDGTLSAETPYAAAPWSSNGRFVVGRGFADGAPANWFHGEIAEVQIFNRVLVDDDFTGRLASDPGSGGVNEPGILAPVAVGEWTFAAARPCYEPLVEPFVCEAREAGRFGRRLAFSQGVGLGQGQREKGLVLNDVWDLDPADPRYNTLATNEYAWSQANSGSSNEPVWHDSRVLRTDDSFTVSVWGYLDTASGSHTIVAQRGSNTAGFWIKYHPDTQKWRFVVSDEDSTTSAQAMVESPETAELGEWIHFVGVYDAGRKHIRFYLNGERVGVTAVGWTPMSATGPLLVGRTWWNGSLAEPWLGGVDDLNVYQGALTDAQVMTLHDEQSVD